MKKSKIKQWFILTEKFSLKMGFNLMVCNTSPKVVTKFVSAFARKWEITSIIPSFFALGTRNIYPIPVTQQTARHMQVKKTPQNDKYVYAYGHLSVCMCCVCVCMCVCVSLFHSAFKLESQTTSVGKGWNGYKLSKELKPIFKILENDSCISNKIRQM